MSKKHLKHAKENIPLFSMNEVEDSVDFIAEKQKSKIPKIKGLVLAGGKSRRMGQDKGLINYHGTPQRDYAANILSPFCKEVYISCRPDQLEQIKSPYPLLADSFLDLGPLGAILSAFRFDPESAWLVVACDLPLLEPQSIEQLIAERNYSKTATAFLNPELGFPEPLITLWEPKSYPITLQFLAQGYSSLRKVLINSDVEVIEAQNQEWLKNVNSPEDKEELLKRLHT
ncbi:MAG: NTP transferase domain-containing protein [Bacteroidota bacterium]